MQGDDDASGDDDVNFIMRDDFFRWPLRLQGTKTTKLEASLLAKKKVTLRAQALATKQMAIANLKKTKTLQDYTKLSLLTMLIDDNLSKQAREYLNLQHNEKVERLKKHIDALKHSSLRPSNMTAS